VSTHDCMCSCSTVTSVNVHAISISLLSGEMSGPNDTPCAPDEKEQDMEAGHFSSVSDGNEDERHASPQRVCMCCNIVLSSRCNVS
jgi:hypothetical protein